MTVPVAIVAMFVAFILAGIGAVIVEFLRGCRVLQEDEHDPECYVQSCPCQDAKKRI